MKCSGKRKKGNLKKKGYGENVKPANIPRKYVATVWLNLFSYAVAIFFRFAVMGNGTFHLWKVWLPMTSVFD